VTPFLAGAGGPEYSGKPVPLDRPLGTQTTENHRALVTPFLTEHANASTQRVFDIDEPLRTQCAQVKGGHFAMVAPFMVPRYGEDPHRNGGRGQEPRALSVERPMPTIVPTQNGAQLVAAFMAKHYGDTGQRPGSSPAVNRSTITSSDHNALVASSLVKLKGTTASSRRATARAPAAHRAGRRQHYAEVRAFMVAYYGNEKDGGTMQDPMRTVTAKERFGLVTVHGEPFVIADIGMRMLAPRELYRAQGFPDSYVIAPMIDGRPMPKDAQVRCVGNSVCPPIAMAVARAQFEQQVNEVAVA
jgi:DNA (cytosine-5)-methyltransferase 1